MITSNPLLAESRANGAPDPLTPHFRFGRQPFAANLAGSRDIFALRYAVYCLECRFLDAAHYPDGLESDEYDAGAAHFMAHNLANELVGSLRLVHASPGLGFPFERHCTALFDTATLPPAEQCGEVSRLVVRRDYRRRAEDTLAGVPKEFLDADAPGVLARRPPNERRSNSPELLLGLYREMYRYSLDGEIRYWYAAMERSLARALSRFQFVFVPIGAEVDYYGPVAPYLADLREMEKRLGAGNPDLLAWFRKG